MYNPFVNLDTTKKDPIILGIETSCDETAAAVIRGREILSDEIASSAKIQALYGGVVPEIASRAHTDEVGAVVERAVKNAGITYADIDAVAVTYGAGLLGALLVGVSFAKAFAYALNKPLIAVNHIRNKFFFKLLIFCDGGDDLAVIISDTEFFGDKLAKLTSAASEFTADGDDLHKGDSFLK